MGYRDGHIGYGKETTAGVYAAPTLFLPYLPSTLKRETEMLKSEAHITGRNGPDPDQFQLGGYKVGGETSHEYLTDDMSLFWEACLGSVSSGTFVPGTIPSYSIQLAHPYPTGTEPASYTGCKVKSWELGFAADEVCTIGLDWAGIHEWLFRTQASITTANGSAVITAGSQVFYPADINSPVSGSGFPSGGSILSITANGGTATLSGTCTASATVTGTIGIAAASPSVAVSKPFIYVQGGIVVGGTTLKVKSGKLAGDNGLDSERTFVGQRHTEEAAPVARRSWTSELEIEFPGRAQYDKFLRETQMTYAFTFTTPGAASVTTIGGTCRYDGVTMPDFDVDEIEMQSLPFECVGDTDPQCITVTLTEPA